MSELRTESKSKSHETRATLSACSTPHSYSLISILFCFFFHAVRLLILTRSGWFLLVNCLTDIRKRSVDYVNGRSRSTSPAENAARMQFEQHEAPHCSCYPLHSIRYVLGESFSDIAAYSMQINAFPFVKRNFPFQRNWFCLSFSV